MERGILSLSSLSSLYLSLSIRLFAGAVWRTVSSAYDVALAKEGLPTATTPLLAIIDDLAASGARNFVFLSAGTQVGKILQSI